MTQPYPPPRPAGPGGRLATALITALAVVGVVLVLTLTDTDAAPTAQGVGGGGGLGTSGDSAASGGSNGVPGSSGTGGGRSGATPSTAQLAADFPLPAGAARIATPDSERYEPAGARYYEVRGTLDGVRAFYVTALAKRGVQLLRPAIDTVNGRIDGYYYNYSSSTLTLRLDLSNNSRQEGVPAGSVRIKVKFGD